MIEGRGLTNRYGKTVAVGVRSSEGSARAGNEFSRSQWIGKIDHHARDDGSRCARRGKRHYQQAPPPRSAVALTRIRCPVGSQDIYPGGNLCSLGSGCCRHTPPLRSSSERSSWFTATPDSKRHSFFSGSVASSQLVVRLKCLFPGFPQTKRTNCPGQEHLRPCFASCSCCQHDSHGRSADGRSSPERPVNRRRPAPHAAVRSVVLLLLGVA